jgi:hypothetical protein
VLLIRQEETLAYQMHRDDGEDEGEQKIDAESVTPVLAEPVGVPSNSATDSLKTHVNQNRDH